MRVGHRHIRTAGEGIWFHEGGLFRREKMVRPSSTVCRREAEGRDWLVTPAERLEIDVEDTPVVAV